ncbi:MAG: metalloregulator ArsR/SmtB family transcription factor [Pseudomonadota bacterium]|nr:metalloregulator ArsR/SmtB family transcription factor [Pseudomonadota bacterium]
MEKTAAIDVLSALAHDHRLDVLRHLVRAGPGGAPAGAISTALDIRPNTLSNNLTVLSAAGLVRSEREGRSIRYFARFETLESLITYLLEDCCGGQLGLCLPILQPQSGTCHD